MIQQVPFSQCKHPGEQSLFTPAISPHLRSTRGYPSCSVVKNPPAKQEMRVRSLGQEDPLEKEIATHSSILDWEVSWTEDPGDPQSMGS